METGNWKLSWSLFAFMNAAIAVAFVVWGSDPLAAAPNTGAVIAFLCLQIRDRRRADRKTDAFRAEGADAAKMGQFSGWRFVRPWRCPESIVPFPSLSISWVRKEKRTELDGWWIWIEVDWLVWSVAIAYDPGVKRTCKACPHFKRCASTPREKCPWVRFVVRTEHPELEHLYEPLPASAFRYE